MSRTVAAASAVVDALLDSAPCGFLSFSDDGTIRIVNATLLEMLGYERDERDALTGRHVETILAVGSRIFYQTHLFPLVRLHGRAEEIYVLLRPRSGEDVGALLNAVRRERDGAFVTDCALMRVVERRKYEDALLQARRTAEQAQAALTERNEALERANALLQSQAQELTLHHQRLQEQAIELEAQQEALAAINDVLVAQAEELEIQRTAADSANRAKSDFLAVMSHELRTPLNAIGGYVQLLDLGVYGPVSEAQRETFDRIARSQRHLLRLINDVLNLARIEAGRVNYAVESVALGEVVDSVLPMLEPQLAAKEITWTVDVARDLRARADREKVQQILINLFTNATKFTPAGGRLRVEGAPHAASPPEVVLRVTDTGIGIPAALLEKVFEAFVQVDTSHTRPVEGSGLGLSISRDLARGMGGDLRALNAPGGGSTFELTLPQAS